MGNSHPIKLRSRVIAFVEEGNTHRGRPLICGCRLDL
ncbi:hypothetical protein AF71_00026270 [Rhizobium sp. 57MFTsu3.2]|nr:hypothetical protein [Rhizobium sp. 57MFTsu3.2]